MDRTMESHVLEQACQTQCLVRVDQKGGDCTEGHHKGGENHNLVRLLIPSLSLRYLFSASIFEQAHKNVNFF
jgi:hypothetical protein